MTSLGKKNSQPSRWLRASSWPARFVLALDEVQRRALVDADVDPAAGQVGLVVPGPAEPEPTGVEREFGDGAAHRLVEAVEVDDVPAAWFRVDGELAAAPPGSDGGGIEEGPDDLARCRARHVDVDPQPGIGVAGHRNAHGGPLPRRCLEFVSRRTPCRAS
nr:hypothetical protein [Asanoa siamensis]